MRSVEWKLFVIIYLITCIARGQLEEEKET